MTTRKTTRKTTANTPEVVKNKDVDTTNGKDVEPRIVVSDKDDVYAEMVTLENGVDCLIEVNTDVKKMPATTPLYLADGNGLAMVLGSLTIETRSRLGWTGATMQDLEDVIGDVVQRSRDSVQ